MKEKLEAQISQFKKAVARLSETLALKPTSVNKDATIQRFEFSFELAWKLMLTFAYEKGVKTISPKDSIRTAAQLELIENVETWFDFLDAHNKSSHIYNEGMAAEVYEQTKKFLPEAKRLIQKVEKSPTFLPGPPKSSPPAV